jgi:hypothetical protein
MPLMVLSVLGAIALGVGAGLFLMYAPAAQAQQPPTTVRVALEPGQKFAGFGWHCYSGGSCELYVATRPMRPGEAPETHTLKPVRDRTVDAYVVTESRGDAR